MRGSSGCLLHFAHLDRAAVLGREQGRLEDALGFVGVGEVGDRHDRLLAAQDVDDVGGLVDEAVLVAQDVGVRPPGADVRVIAAARCT